MKPLLDDGLWARIEPILPPERQPSKKGGRPRVGHRATLTGILFILRTGIPWQMLPLEMGCGSGSTCWRRFRAWTKRGVWRDLHLLLLQELAWVDEIDWERVALDSSSVAAKRGAAPPARIQRIKARRAANAMVWSTPRGSRSRFG
jgi:transposase